jgi:hypothetical protein
MGKAIYVVCALTSLVCAVLLLRAWLQSRTTLLLWSALCFAGLTLNNALLVVDRIVLPTTVDLTTARLAVATASVALLVVGLVWESD